MKIRRESNNIVEDQRERRRGIAGRRDYFLGVREE